jgi:spore maturation protein SpmA/spore maturation protein SpmB
VNIIFFALIAIAFLVAAYQQWIFVPTAPDVPIPMDAMTTAVVEAAGKAVDLAIGLIGVMALFLGLMKIIEEAGLLKVIARLVKPLMIRLFPDVPPEHPAMGAMIMNMSANFLGLGNAATPFGIKAMEELNKLNPTKGTATNAMALFLGINTAGFSLLPTSVIALRAESGSHDPAGIVTTTLFASIIAFMTAIFASKTLQRFFPGGRSEVPVPAVLESGEADSGVAGSADTSAESTESLGAGYPLWVSVLAFAAMLSLIPLMILYGKGISPWIIPVLIVSMVSYGFIKRVPVYEVFIAGAKEGFDISVRIIPYLVAILVAVAMFRESGAMNLLIAPLGAITAPLGLPAEALTLAIMRSLSGSGSFGLLATFFKDPAIGPDSYTGYLTSTIYGSSETTFYVLAVYFGAVQVQKIRHALVTGVVTEIAAVIAAIVICSILHR